jgi:hypothetical protein
MVESSFKEFQSALLNFNAYRKRESYLLEDFGKLI